MKPVLILSLLLIAVLQFLLADARADTTVQQDDAAATSFQEHFSRFAAGKEDSLNDQDMDNVRESTADTVNSARTEPRPIIRVQSKVMDFYTGRKQRHTVAIYIMLTSFLSRFTTRHMEAILPNEHIQLMTMARRRQKILIQDTNGIWVEKKLKSKKWYSFRTNNFGKFPFAIVPPADLVDVAYIRIRTDSMPADYSYIYAASLNFLRGISQLTPEKLRQERGGVRIVGSTVNQRNLQAAVSVTNQLVPIMLFSGAKSAFDAQKDGRVTGLDARLRINDYRQYRRDNPVDISKKRHRDDKDGEVNGIDGGDNEVNEEPAAKRMRIRKRSFDPTLMVQHHEHSFDPNLHDHIDSDLLLRQHAHFEFTFDDAASEFKFVTHDRESIHRRIAQLTNTTVEEAKHQHRLFKRNAQFQSYVKSGTDQFMQVWNETDAAESKSIVITTDGDHLIVKFFTWGGKLIRKIIDTVRQAYQVVKQILQRVGVVTRQLVPWLRAVFNWDSILRALKVSTMTMEKLPVHAMQMLSGHGSMIKRTVSHWKHKIIGSLDSFISRLKGQGSFAQVQSTMHNELADVQQEDHQLTFMQDYINQNVNSTSGAIRCQGMPSLSGLDEVKALEAMAERIYSKVVHKLQPSLSKDSFISKLDTNLFGKGMFAAAAADFLIAVRNVLEPIFHVTQEVAEIVFVELALLLNDLTKMVHCRIHIPGVSELYEHVITRGTQRLSLASLSSLPGTVAFVIMYKSMHQAQEPFDNHDVAALTLAEKPTDYLARWLECADCRTAEQLPVASRLNTLTWLHGYNKIFMAGMLALTEPAQATIKYLVPFKPVFQFLHHMTAFPFQLSSSSSSVPSGASYAYAGANGTATFDATAPPAVNPVAIHTWCYGLLPLVFMAGRTPTRSVLEMAVRVPHVALSVLEFETEFRQQRRQMQVEQRQNRKRSHAADDADGEQQQPESLNPLSAVAWRHRLKGLSDVLNAVPQPPGPSRLAAYKLNPRAIAASLDLIRMQLSMWMNWRF